VYDDFVRFWLNKSIDKAVEPYVPAPQTQRGRFHAGHAVRLVGWTAAAEWIVANTWGGTPGTFLVGSIGSNPRGLESVVYCPSNIL
jgi:hypothetical protein